jgi:hypothetical protein
LQDATIFHAAALERTAMLVCCMVKTA